MARVSLMRLPSELLLMIASHLDSTAAISNLSRTARRLFDLLEDYLYIYDVSVAGTGWCKSLEWAVSCKFSVDDQVRFAQKAIKAGCDVNCHIPIGSFTPTLISVAVLADCSIPLLQTLIDAGADINKFDDSSHPAIWYATVLEKTNALRFLLDQPGIDLIVKKDGNESMLYMAVSLSLFDVARILLPRSDPNIPKQRTTPLCVAISNADDKMVSLLLSSKDLCVNNSYPDSYPYGTHFSYACSRSSLAIVQLLHDDSRVDVDLCNNPRNLPIKCAMKHDLEIVRFLIRSTKCKTARDHVFRRACAEKNIPLAQEVLQVAGERDKNKAREWKAVARDFGLNHVASLIDRKWGKE